jgi:LemA protein
MRRALPVILIVSAAVAAGAIAGRGKYNDIRTDLEEQRRAIDAQWSQVDLAIQHRADMAAQLLRDSMGGAPEAPALEKEFETVRAELAAAASPEQKIRANQRIASVLAEFQTIAATHARLRSRDVLARLSDAENRIAVERRRYNDMLEHYNAQIQRFPDNIVATLAGFSRDNAYFPTEPRP